MRVSGLRKISVPFGLSIGRGTRLLAAGGTLEKNIILQKQTWIGEDVEFNCTQDQLIHIKCGSTIQDRSKIIGDVVIERNCTLAPNVYISSGNHEAFEWPALDIREQDKIRTANPLQKNKCHIEEDVWLGINVFIKAGVTIGRGAVVGANSVVTKSVKPYSVVAGSPAKELRTRLNFEPPTELDRNQPSFPYLYRGVSRVDFSLQSNSVFILSGTAAAKLNLEIISEKAGSAALKTNRSQPAVFELIVGTNSLTIPVTCEFQENAHLSGYTIVEFENFGDGKIFFKKLSLE